MFKIICTCVVVVNKAAGCHLLQRATIGVSVGIVHFVAEYK